MNIIDEQYEMFGERRATIVSKINLKEEERFNKRPGKTYS